MSKLDPLVYGEKVSEKVFDKSENSRLVRRFRKTDSYCGITTIDVIGCDQLCSYCYVYEGYLTGAGSRLKREIEKGDIKK